MALSPILRFIRSWAIRNKDTVFMRRVRSYDITDVFPAQVTGTAQQGPYIRLFICSKLRSSSAREAWINPAVMP
jgi:hypothetical protein